MTPAPPPIGVIILGEPSFDLTPPAMKGLHWQARIRMGTFVTETEDAGYCRMAGNVWLAAAQALESSEAAQRTIAEQLAPVPSLTPVGDGPAAGDAADESPGPASHELPQRAELHDCPPCALSNCEECWARPERGTEARACLCDTEGHPAVAVRESDQEASALFGEQDEVTG